MTDIVVYNLSDDGVPTDAVASQPASTVGATVVSATSSTAAPSGSQASSITEGDVRAIIHNELSHYSGDIRIGSLLSGQVFILDSSGMRMGDTKFSDAPFSVDYNGNLVATSATITIATLGGFNIGSDYIRDVANTFGLASTVTGSNDTRFWSGAAFASRSTAPFRLFEDGSFVATDGTFSGTVRTTVFEKDVVSAVGGQLIVANADVLDTTMTALDSATLTIKGETTFAVNDMLHIKDGTDEEYLRVTAIGSAPTYSVTRDLAAAYASNNNPAWAAGTAVVVEGSSDGASTYSGGFLKLLGSGTNSPKYSVFKRTGAAYGGISEYATLGNLNGRLDYVTDEYGVAIGETTKYMSYDPTNGLRIEGAASVNGSSLGFQNIYGDGSDGTATISSNTSITKDMFYTSLTITSGAHLDTAGFRVHVNGTLTVTSGSIGRPGLAGTAGSAGGNGIATTSSNSAGAAGAAGVGGAALADGSLKGAVAGTNGTAGMIGATVGNGNSLDGNSSTSSTAASSVAKSLTGSSGSVGGTGGNGGNCTTSAQSRTGGTGAAAGAAGTTSGTVFNKPNTAFGAWLLQDFFPSQDALKSSAGSSGGAGAASGAVCALSGTQQRASSGGGGGAGGAGGAGGIVAIYAKKIVIAASGIITALSLIHI